MECLYAWYIGPFIKILNQDNPVSYHLQLPSVYEIYNPFHVSLLKPVVFGPLDEVTPPTSPLERLNIEEEARLSTLAALKQLCMHIIAKSKLPRVTTCAEPV